MGSVKIKMQQLFPHIKQMGSINIYPKYAVMYLGLHMFAFLCVKMLPKYAISTTSQFKYVVKILPGLMRFYSCGFLRIFIWLIVLSHVMSQVTTVTCLIHSKTSKIPNVTCQLI